MKPKSGKYGKQLKLFRERLSSLLNPDHELFQLANLIEWDRFEVALDGCYSDTGRPGAPIRLLVGLMYLKYTFNISDEQLAPRWEENPYWQYFCGYEYLQHKFPIDYTTLIKWRKRVGVEKLRELLKETIDLAVREEALDEGDLKRVNVDTTVQEKAISFPTDSRLAQALTTKLANEAKAAGIDLRQSYLRISKKMLIKVGGYCHAKQFKRMRKGVKTLENWLGRLVRDIERKLPKDVSESLLQLLDKANRFLEHGKKGQDKLYSIHEPDVKCICKGKAHKRYEFGQKVSVATTNKSNWIVSVDLLRGNPYDGHSLGSVVKSIEKTATIEVEEIFVDKGYRGHNYKGKAKVYIAGKGRKKAPPSLLSRMNRRAAVEPKIGHLKLDHRMGRCFLKGLIGDEINALMAGAGSNLRKMLNLIRAKAQFFCLEIKFYLYSCQNFGFRGIALVG